MQQPEVLALEPFLRVVEQKLTKCHQKLNSNFTKRTSWYFIHGDQSLSQLSWFDGFSTARVTSKGNLSRESYSDFEQPIFRCIPSIKSPHISDLDAIYSDTSVRRIQITSLVSSYDACNASTMHFEIKLTLTGFSSLVWLIRTRSPSDFWMRFSTMAKLGFSWGCILTKWRWSSIAYSEELRSGFVPFFFCINCRYPVGFCLVN